MVPPNFVMFYFILLYLSLNTLCVCFQWIKSLNFVGPIREDTCFGTAKFRRILFSLLFTYPETLIFRHHKILSFSCFLLYQLYILKILCVYFDQLKV